MAEDCEKKAADLAFDLTKQFLTLAFGGIAFVAGLSFSSPGAVSSILLWWVIGVFGASAVLGLVVLMHGVNLLGEKKTFDVYVSSLRILSLLQIASMLTGTVLLIPILNSRSEKKTGLGNVMELKVSPQQTLTYPIDPNKSATVEFENGKLKITETKK
jgi:hypothetical protein